MQNPKMGDLVVVGLCHLQTLCNTYEQFISGLGDFFPPCSVHSSLW